MAETEIATLQTGLTWLQRHERLLLALIAAAVVLLVSRQWLDRTAAKDRLAATSAAETLEAQKQANAQMAAQVAQGTQQYQALVTNVAQQNAALAAAAQSRTVVLQAQQKTDSTLDAASVAARLTALEKLSAGSVTAAPSNSGVDVSLQGGRQITSDLESIPALQQNLAGTQTELKNCEATEAAGAQVIQQQGAEIAGLQKENADADVGCKATVSSVKASARKGKWNWFAAGVGVGVGLVAGLVIAVHK